MAHHLAHCLPPHYRNQVREWLEEDAPSFDIGGYVVGEEAVEAFLLCKGTPEGAGGASVGGAILAGVPYFTAVFESLGCTVEWLFTEGDVIVPPSRAAIVRGPARAVLLGERTGLNILTRASGVATAARAMRQVCDKAGWKGEVAGSRKVTPGAFRQVEKYALLVGGVSTHRMDLSQMVMLKGASAAGPSQLRLSQPLHKVPTSPPLPTPQKTIHAARRQPRVGCREHHHCSAGCQARGRV